MDLGVIIVTYNRINLLKECVEACKNQTYKFKKILIVNNNSTDGTNEYLNTIKGGNIDIINLNDNIGGAGGFYTGTKNIEIDKLDYILYIDDDAILDLNYNMEIVKNIEKYTNEISAFSGTVKTNDNIQCDHRKHLKSSFKMEDSKEEEYEKDYFDYELASFCGLYVSTKIINRIGLPRKDFFIWYDDTEYSLRIGQYSKIRNINKAFLNHKTNISNSGGFNWKSYYGIRNQLVIIKQYFSKWVLLKNIINIRFMILAGKIMKIVKRKEYYGKVADIYSTALKDALNNNLGKSLKYFPGYKISKED